jgi:hypothetical protein
VARPVKTLIKHIAKPGDKIGPSKPVPKPAPKPLVNKPIKKVEKPKPVKEEAIKKSGEGESKSK